MIRRLLTIFSINFTTGVRKSKPLSLLSVKAHIHISYNMSDRISKLLWKACIQQLISTAPFFNEVCGTEFFCNCWKIRGIQRIKSSMSVDKDEKQISQLNFWGMIEIDGFFWKIDIYTNFATTAGKVIILFIAFKRGHWPYWVSFGLCESS